MVTKENNADCNAKLALRHGVFTSIDSGLIVR